MGRLLLYSAIGALTLFVLSAAFVLQKGGGRSEAVEEVSLRQLVSATEAYRNHKVTTEGLLLYIRRPKEHFVIEWDEERVLITGLSKKTLLNMEGSTVKVTGRFDFDEEMGRFIQVESITVVR